MKKSKFTEEQILFVLKQAGADQLDFEIFREHLEACRRIGKAAWPMEYPTAAELSRPTGLPPNGSGSLDCAGVAIYRRVLKDGRGALGRGATGTIIFRFA